MQRRGLVLATLMQLKQICNHPALHLKGHQFNPKESGKFDELQRLCEDIAAKQEKVLVFSQFQSMCEPLSQFMEGHLVAQAWCLPARHQPRRVVNW